MRSRRPDDDVSTFYQIMDAHGQSAVTPPSHFYRLSNPLCEICRLTAVENTGIAVTRRLMSQSAPRRLAACLHFTPPKHPPNFRDWDGKLCRESRPLCHPLFRSQTFLLYTRVRKDSVHRNATEPLYMPCESSAALSPRRLA